MDSEEVDDLVQDTLLSLLENDCRRLRAFDAARGGFARWVAVIARRRALDWAKRTHPITVPLDEAPELATPPPSAPPNEENGLSIPEGLLSPREQQVIESVYMENLSARDLEKKLGISRQAVYDHKSRGLKKLRDHLEARSNEKRA